MAKNELLPFADGEDANVLPTNQWEALTDILENGFQSGIARSEQVNRVLAQGAVASYVLGQLIVDQLNKDATLDKDTLYQNIVKALQENAKDACLALNGSNKMSGNLGFAASKHIFIDQTDGYMRIWGGKVNDGITGGNITLFGGEHSTGWGAGAGGLQLEANNGTVAKSLKLSTEGTLVWDGHSINHYLNTKVSSSIATDGSDVTIPFDGLLIVEGHVRNVSYGHLSIYLDGVLMTKLGGNDYDYNTLSIPVKKGQTFKAVSNNSESSSAKLWAFK